jgi:hypothetical protein
VGTFWAHLGTNRRNPSELRHLSFRRSAPFRRRDLGNAEGSNPSATASNTRPSAQVDRLIRGPSPAGGQPVDPVWTHFCGGPCPGHRSPCPNRTITDVMAEAAVAAAEHLNLLGTPGVFDVATCRAQVDLGWPKTARLCHLRARRSLVEPPMPASRRRLRDAVTTVEEARPSCAM